MHLKITSLSKILDMLYRAQCLIDNGCMEKCIKLAYTQVQSVWLLEHICHFELLWIYELKTLVLSSVFCFRGNNLFTIDILQLNTKFLGSFSWDLSFYLKAAKDLLRRILHVGVAKCSIKYGIALQHKLVFLCQQTHLMCSWRIMLWQ